MNISFRTFMWAWAVVMGVGVTTLMVLANG